MERSDLSSLLGGRSVTSGRAIIAEGAPAAFQRAFANAVAGSGEIFLSDPNWGPAERGRLAGMPVGNAAGSEGWLMIPTGGSGGGSKFARHDGWTISAAVRGFKAHFAMEKVNALNVLPLHHVSGFMAWMRCLMTGGTLACAEWKDIEDGRYPAALPARCCLSLVPTQLQRLLAVPSAVAWLRNFEVIFVGGGPTWAALLEQAAAFELPPAPSYGSTETGAMAAALLPRQFLAGMRGSGQPLPHCAIDLPDEVVRVQGDSIFRGYYPSWDQSREWLSGDLGSWDRHGSLVIAGRRDDLVITGGEKVLPLEVEEVLRASGEFEDVVVLGLPDPQWGQRLVAYHPASRVPRPAVVEAALAALAPYKRPKLYLPVAPWPRDAQGKVRRSELLALPAIRPPPS